MKNVKIILLLGIIGINSAGVFSATAYGGLNYDLDADTADNAVMDADHKIPGAISVNDIKPGGKEKEYATLADVAKAANLAFKNSRSVEIPSPEYQTVYGIKILKDVTNPSYVVIDGKSVALYNIRESNRPDTVIVKDDNTAAEYYTKIDRTDHTSVKERRKFVPLAKAPSDEQDNIFGVKLVTDKDGNILIQDKVFPSSRVRESRFQNTIIVKGDGSQEYYVTVDPNDPQKASYAEKTTDSFDLDIPKDRQGNFIIGGKSWPASRVKESRFPNTVIIVGDHNEDFYAELDPNNPSTILSQRKVEKKEKLKIDARYDTSFGFPILKDPNTADSLLINGKSVLLKKIFKTSYFELKYQNTIGILDQTKQSVFYYQINRSDHTTAKKVYQSKITKIALGWYVVDQTKELVGPDNTSYKAGDYEFKEGEKTFKVGEKYYYLETGTEVTAATQTKNDDGSSPWARIGAKVGTVVGKYVQKKDIKAE